VLRWSGAAVVVVGVLVTLSFFLLLQPIDELDLQTTEFYRQSLQNLDVALQDRPATGASELLAGAARVEIAPPLEWEVGLGGTRLLSVSRARDKSEESVHARALAVSDGRKTIVLLAADILVFSPELRRRTLALVQEDVSIESRDFLAVATHTHSGPGSYWKGGLSESVLGSYQERALDFLAHRFAESAVMAVAEMRPARLSTDSVELHDGLANKAQEGGQLNPELRLIRFEGEQDSFSIDLLNYSAHPTSLLPANRRSLSGDYPGILSMQLETDRRMVLFTPGTIGDMKASDIEGDSGPQSSAIARYLAGAGLDKMSPTPVERPVLESYEIEVPLPPVQLRVSGSGLLGSHRLRDSVARRVLEEDLSVTRLQVVRLGTVLLFGVPCDLSTSIGMPVLQYAREAGFVPVIMSMSNEWIGYVLTESEYRQGSHKATSQLHGPLTGPLFRTLMLRVVDRLARRSVDDLHPGKEARSTELAEPVRLVVLGIEPDEIDLQEVVPREVGGLDLDLELDALTLAHRHRRPVDQRQHGTAASPGQELHRVDGRLLVGPEGPNTETHSGRIDTPRL
jgi:hypothetical protein